jgi:hypothetical protein
MTGFKGAMTQFYICNDNPYNVQRCIASRDGSAVITIAAVPALGGVVKMFTGIVESVQHDPKRGLSREWLITIALTTFVFHTGTLSISIPRTPTWSSYALRSVGKNHPDSLRRTTPAAASKRKPRSTRRVGLAVIAEVPRQFVGFNRLSNQAEPATQQ